MPRDERADTIVEMRNALMSSLRAVYPGSLAGETLFRIMLGAFPEYERATCVKDLFYLEEKGYVRRRNARGREDKTVDWASAKWQQTADGNEVANNLVDDPALEI